VSPLPTKDLPHHHQNQDDRDEKRGADPQIWKNPNKAGGTPLFIAEGYISRLPRPDTPTIEAITKLMVAAGISTEGERPKIVDSYEKPAVRPSQPPK
jgi:hypothetical protein